MKLPFKQFFALSLIFFLISCEDSDAQTDVISEELAISVSEVCGWCGGYDELVISQRTFSYSYENSCEDSLNIPKEYFDTQTDRWDQLISLLNKRDFKRIDLNTCSVCVDGCDKMITIEDGAYKHSIRFDKDSVGMGSQQAFVSSLLQLLKETREDLQIKQ